MNVHGVYMNVHGVYMHMYSTRVCVHQVTNYNFSRINNNVHVYIFSSLTRLGG